MTRKSKTKLIQKQLIDSDVTEMFNQMLGQGKLNIEIIYPKYIELYDKLSNIALTFSNLSADDGIINTSYPEMQHWRTECNIFSKKILDVIGTEKASKLLIENSSVYLDLKTHDIVRHIVLICNKLIEYKSQLIMMRDKFIYDQPGISLKPFHFSDFDLKVIWSSKQASENPKIKKSILSILNIIFTYSYDIYKLATSPDIDVTKFSKIIIESLSEARKILPRCERAFKKLEESVNLLVNKFDSYYKDFIQTRNPSIIMQNFVLDVSKTQSADLEITYQFKKIIDHFRKVTAGKIDDPKLNKMFNLLNQNFEALEKEQTKKE